MSDFSNQWIEIFRAGDHGAKGTWSDDDVKKIVANFDPTTWQPPLVLGHPEHDAPAMGQVSELRADGPRLLMRASKVHPALEALVHDGRYPNRSAAFYVDPEGTGPVLRHVGFLGATPPEVKGLARINFSDGEFLTFDSASGTGGKDVKKNRYAFNTAVIYKGKKYRSGDTIDLAPEEFHAFPQPHMLKNIGDAESLDSGRTRVGNDLTVLHAEEKGMQKFRYIFNTNVTYGGKTFGPGDTIDLTAEEAAAADPQGTVLLRLGTVEALDARTRANVDRPVLVDSAKKAIIAGPAISGPSDQETSLSALKFADALCRARGIPGPRLSARALHSMVDPVTVSFSEKAEERVTQMRLQGRKEPEHILMGEAMKGLRHRGVASSSF